MGTETVQRSNFISYVEYEISVAIIYFIYSSPDRYIWF